MNEKKYPIKFLDPYSREDADLFFGREDEIDQLYQMTFQSNIILVHGVSGSGKTSLIRCGLASKFESHDWLAVDIRRNTDINISLQKAIDEAIGNSQEVHTHHEWLQDVFDIDEEVKSNSPLEQAFNKIYLNYFRPVYLIFDQFEELYILGSLQEQAMFITTVKEIIAMKHPVKLIFSIREEYLGYLYNFEKEVPQLLRKKVRIEPMNLDKVRDVVEGITTNENSLITLDPLEINDFSEQLFDKIKGKNKRLTIDLPYLQVFLDKLYLHITNDPGRIQEANFSIEYLEKTGDIDDLLKEFLDDQVKNIVISLNADHPRTTLETIFTFLSQFVTLEGTKEPLTQLELSSRLTDYSPEFIDATLKLLINHRILRYSETDDIYEIAHDSLALRIAEKRSDEEIAILEVRRLIKSHVSIKKDARELFTEKQLGFIEPLLNRIVLSKDENDLVQDSIKNIQQKKNKRRRLLRLTFSIMFAGLTIVSVLCIWAFRQNRIAQRTLGLFFKDDSSKAAWGTDFSTGKYGVIDRNGQIQGEGFVWENPNPFTGEYSIAKKNDSCYFVNQLGKVVSTGYGDIIKTNFPAYYYADEQIVFFNGMKFEAIANHVETIMDLQEPLIKLFSFKKQGKYGFIDRAGTEVIPAMFDSIVYAPRNYYKYVAVKQNKYWSFVNLISGDISKSFFNQEMLVNRLDSLETDKSHAYKDIINESESRQGRFKIIQAGKQFGIFDINKKLILPTEYFDISYFIGDSIFLVGQNKSGKKTNTEKNWALFNAVTERFSSFQSKQIENFSGSYWFLEVPDTSKMFIYGYTIYAKKDGSFFQYPDFRPIPVNILNRDARIVSSKKYQDVDISTIHIGDVANIRNDVKTLNFPELSNNASIYQYDEKFGLIGTKGNMLTPLIYDEIFAASEGLRLAIIDKKYGFIDSTGWIIPFVYDEARAFSKGHARVKIRQKYGFIDTRGRTVIPCKYDNLNENVSGNNLIGAKIGGKWGCINLKEEWVIKPLYDTIGEFYHGIAIVVKSGKYGYIDSLGRLIHDINFQHARSPAENGWARIKNNDKWGFVNIISPQQITPVYDTVTPFAGNHAWAKQGNSWFVLNDSDQKSRPIRNINSIITYDNNWALVSMKDEKIVLFDSVGNYKFKLSFTFDVNDDKIVFDDTNQLINFYSNDSVRIVTFGGRIKLARENQKGYSPNMMAVNDGWITRSGDYILKGNYKLKQVGYRIFELDSNGKKGYVAFTGFGQKKVDMPEKINVRRFLPPVYEAIGFPLDQEYMPVKQNGKWGFIQWVSNKKGPDIPKLTIPCKYDQVVPFISTGDLKVALVVKGKQTYWINEKDELLFQPAPETQKEDY